VEWRALQLGPAALGHLICGKSAGYFDHRVVSGYQVGFGYSDEFSREYQGELGRLSNMSNIFRTVFALLSMLALPARAEVERGQVVDGNLFTIIAPTYNSARNLSYIRFFNTNPDAASTFSITVVGSPSGQSYGTTTVAAPKNASIQLSLTDILSRANAAALNSGDTNYSIYMRNPDTFSAWQHVLFNDQNRFFENVTICQFFSGALHTRVIPIVGNMHTSRIGGYPSEITVHNYTNATRSYVANVFDSTTGASLGSVPLSVGANTTARLSTDSIEQQLNFVPSASQFHMNVKLGDASSPTELTAVIGHNVINQEFNAALNMTAWCRVKP